MHPVSVHGRPSFPYAHIFAHCSVPATRDITQNPIKEHFSAPRGGMNSRVYRRIEVGDHQRGRRQARRLVHEQMGTLVVRVVGDQKPGRDGRFECGVVGVEGFEDLGGLGIWSVVRLCGGWTDF